MESIRERDLHKSLKLLLKECDKDLSPLIDLRLKSSNLKERPRITLSGRDHRGKGVAGFTSKDLLDDSSGG